MVISVDRLRPGRAELVALVLLLGACLDVPSAGVSPDIAIQDLAWDLDVGLGPVDGVDTSSPLDVATPDNKIILIDTLPVGDAGPAPAFAWVSSGTPDRSNGLAVDMIGASYITGAFSGKDTIGSLTLDNGRSDEDVFVAKLDPKGALVWAVSAGGTAEDAGRDITLDSGGNLLITGSFFGKASFGKTTVVAAGGNDIFVAKLDAAGKFLWVRTAGGTGPDIGHGISSDSAGHVLVTGEFSGKASFGSKTLSSPGAADMFAAKYDQNGKLIWAIQAGGNKSVYGSSIDVDAKGTAYVTGAFKDSFTYGAKTLKAAGLTDLFVVKLDETGRFLWAVSAGGSSYTVGNSIAVAPSGESHITGWFGVAPSGGWSKFGGTTLVAKTSGDMLVAKLDNSGKFLWAVAGGGKENDAGNGIDLDSSSNVYVTGYFNSPTSVVIGPASAQFGAATIKAKGSTEIFVTRLNPQGVFKWAAPAGGVMRDEGTAIGVGPAGGVYVTGNYADTATFGALSATSKSCWDIFVTRLGAIAGP